MILTRSTDTVPVTSHLHIVQVVPRVLGAANHRPPPAQSPPLTLNINVIFSQWAVPSVLPAPLLHPQHSAVPLPWPHWSVFMFVYT